MEVRGLVTGLTSSLRVLVVVEEVLQTRGDTRLAPPDAVELCGRQQEPLGERLQARVTLAPEDAVQIVRCLVAVVENPGPALDGLVGEALLKERDRVAGLQVCVRWKARTGAVELRRSIVVMKRTLPMLAEAQISTKVQTSTTAFPR